MSNLRRLNNYRNISFISFIRLLTVALLIGSWLMLPIGLPGTSNFVDAQSCVSGVRCPNDSFNVAALVNTIDVYRLDTNNYLVIFDLRSGLTQSGSCGAGNASFIQVNGGSCGGGYTSSENQYALVVNNAGCANGSFTVGYRVFAYIKPDTSLLRKVHGNLTINPSHFAIGQGIQNYAPVPGC